MVPLTHQVIENITGALPYDILTTKVVEQVSWMETLHENDGKVSFPLLIVTEETEDASGPISDIIGVSAYKLTRNIYLILRNLSGADILVSSINVGAKTFQASNTNNLYVGQFLENSNWASTITAINGNIITTQDAYTSNLNYLTSNVKYDVEFLLTRFLGKTDWDFSCEFQLQDTKFVDCSPKMILNNKLIGNMFQGWSGLLRLEFIYAVGPQ